MKNKLPSKPQMLTIDITDRCQMKCVTCSKWQVSSEVMHKELTTEQWKEVFRQLREWLGDGFWICFSGGEPFLRPDIFELTEYATSLGFKVSSMTNAFSVEHLVDKIIDNKFESLNVSLNSIVDKSIHDTSRGREGSAQKICDFVWQIMNYKKGRNDNLSINLATIMLPENLDEIVYLIEYATKNHLKNIMFQLIEDKNSFHAYADRKEIDTDNYVIPEEYKKTVMDMAEKAIPIIDHLIEMKRAGHAIANSYEQLEAYKIFFNNPEDIIKAITCDVGSTNFAVDPYGDVRLCFNMKPIGSILEKTPQELWNSEEAAECRKKVHTCKMCCRLINCNFKANFANFNKPFLVRLKNKILNLFAFNH
ncbi:MAG: radical SAM/SPASM domain-containing protein [Candidatus Gastranaerophilaceae bacterium]